jgi:hypothetical protein
VTEFNPSATQRVTAAVRKRIVKNPAARWNDLSSRFARYGAFVQGGLLLLPKQYQSVELMGAVAILFYILVQGAKLVAEERNRPEDSDASN